MRLSGVSIGARFGFPPVPAKRLSLKSNKFAWYVTFGLPCGPRLRCTRHIAPTMTTMAAAAATAAIRSPLDLRACSRKAMYSLKQGEQWLRFVPVGTAKKPANLQTKSALPGFELLR